jgi:L-threonylcarbamoyladenylate synthase
LDHLQRLGYRGVNVTVPHKAEAFAWCPSHDEWAARVGVVNTINLRTRHGANTDAPGFLASLAGLAVGRALVLGAGGSAVAVVRALESVGWDVTVWARRPEAAQALGVGVANTLRTEGFDLVVNATSAGLAGETLPVEWVGTGLAYDLVYGPAAQPFLQPPQQAGWAAQDGLSMLIHQAALALAQWEGCEPPVAAMECAVRPVPYSGEHQAVIQGHLQRGQLVVVPTETVFGLAANALDPDAVARIFAAKGRPADNPLIVHVRDVAQAQSLAAEWPDLAQKLADAFWPGPLTMVLPKQAHVPAITTAGLDSVALRCPRHPVLPALLAVLDFPLAAPSANLSESLSPTALDDLEPRLTRRAAAVLQGEPTEFGIESTVVRVTPDGVRLLRPGAISRAQIEAVVGAILANDAEEKASPGLRKRHYAPRTPIHLVDQLDASHPGLVIGSPTIGPQQVAMPADPHAYAQSLYRELARLDRAGHKAIFIQRPPSTPEWEAVHDRLNRMVG